MIVVQDRIEVPPADLARLERMFRDRYIPAAAERGLEFVEMLICPPVRLRVLPCTLWLRWHVADVAAWWAMRARSGTGEVAAFWAEVDALCCSRERVCLTAGNAGALSGPEDISRFGVETGGHRETAQLALRDDISTDDRAGLLAILEGAAQQLRGLEMVVLGKNLAPEYAAGHYTLDLLYPDRNTAAAVRASPFWQGSVQPALKQCCAAVHALGLETIGAGLRRPELAGGIKRTAFFRLLPGVDDSIARRFESDLLEMPGHILSILNWRLSRAVRTPWDSAAVTPWTYVWEQEYENVEGLTVSYMAHPYHWAHIDRWFDPESGVQAVDADLSHAFSPLAQSLMACEVRS